MSVAFLYFFPSSLASTPNGLAGHLELITSTSVNCFNCHERAVKREYIFSLSLIICQTFVSRSTQAIFMHITKRTDARSFAFIRVNSVQLGFY